MESVMMTPADVVTTAFDAINLDDWNALAELCDPVSLRLFKQEILDQATAKFRRFPTSADDISGRDLTDTEDDFAVMIDPEKCLSRELFNVRTLEELREMDLLGRILCVRSFPVTAMCRRQADGSWRLIASSSLYLVPTVALIDAA